MADCIRPTFKPIPSISPLTTGSLHVVKPPTLPILDSPTPPILPPPITPPMGADSLFSQLQSLLGYSPGTSQILVTTGTGPGTNSAYWTTVIGSALPTLTPFELYDDIAPGQTNKYVWSLNADYSRNTSAGYTTVQVSDAVLGDVRAYGSNHSGWTSATGAKGFYTPGTDGKNQIVAIRRLAREIKVTVGSTAVSAGATFTPVALAVMDAGQDPSNGGAAYPTIKNYSTGLPASAAGVICAWDGSADQYLVIDAPCP